MLLSDTNMQSESFASKESELGEMDEFNHDGDCRGADVHDTSPKLSVPREKQIQVLVSQADAYYQSLLHEYRFSPKYVSYIPFISFNRVYTVEKIHDENIKDQTNSL